MPSLLTTLAGEAQKQGLVITLLTAVGTLLGTVVAYHVAYYLIDPHGVSHVPDVQVLAELISSTAEEISWTLFG